MPHHSTYRRIEAEVVDPQELEQVVSNLLAGRKFFGKQVLLSIDGKVLPELKKVDLRQKVDSI